MHAEYLSRTPASRRMHERLLEVLPGGETRSVTHYEPYPVALEAGAGSAVWDVDGNRYIDVLNNYTSLVHGHGYPPILEAVARATASGVAFPAPHRALLALAEYLVARYPAVDLIRFTNSGTEAALLGLRIARNYTGRQAIVLFEGGYHGTAAQFIDPDPSVRRVPFNDAAALREAVNDRTAAVFVEPFLGSGGVIAADTGFLAEIRDATLSVGALMVLDEVQSLRNHVSGAHGALNLEPDLVLMGKIIGGGTPVGAVGGRAELLLTTSARNPHGILHSGTFNGNPLTMAAGLASMQHLDGPTISLLNRRAEGLAASIEEAGASLGIPAKVTRAGSILHVHLPPDLPGNGEMEAHRVTETSSLHLALLLEGVYSAPRGMLNLSTVLSEADLSEVAAAYARALARLAVALTGVV